MGVVALLLGTVSLGAQEKTALVRGVVSDDEGRHLGGVSIEVLGTKLAVTTAEDGVFRFERVPAGRYWIVVRRIGYAPVRLTATLLPGLERDLPIELERVPQRLSELTVLSHGGMSKYRYQDFFTRSHSAFGTFLTRDDLAQSRAYDLVSLVQRQMPGKTRFALEQRTGGDGYAGGRLYRRGGYLYGRDEFGLFVPVGTSALGLYHSPNCAPGISVNGATPWPGVSLLDFDLEQVEALEIYRRGSWVPTEFSYRETSGCGLVVVWTK
jgi:hypothetical protein